VLHRLTLLKKQGCFRFRVYLFAIFYMIICLQIINTGVTIIYKQEGISPKTKHGGIK